MITIPIIFKVKNCEILRDTITIHDYNTNIFQLFIYINSAFSNYQLCSYDDETLEKIFKWQKDSSRFTR